MKRWYIIGSVIVLGGVLLLFNKRKGKAMETRASIFLDLIRDNKTKFLDEINAISSRLNISPNWLLAVMYKESRLNPQAVNKTGGATGLIQFMPKTAIGLGTTTEELYNMTNLQQLVYVEKYFKPYANKIKSYLDLYLVTFFPAALKHDDNWYFETKTLTKEKIGIQNKGINSGKPINKIAFKNYLLKNIDKKYLDYLS